MITQATTHGGCTYLNGSSQTVTTGLLKRFRSFTVANTGAVTMTMPDARTLPTGGPVVTIKNLATGALTIKDAAGTTFATVASGDSVIVFLIANTTLAGSWRSMAISAARLYQRADRDSIALVTPPAVSGSCIRAAFKLTSCHDATVLYTNTNLYKYLHKVVFITGGYPWPYLVEIFNDMIPVGATVINITLQKKSGKDAVFASCPLALGQPGVSGGGGADLDNQPVTFSYAMIDTANTGGLLKPGIGLYAASALNHWTYYIGVTVTGIVRFKPMKMNTDPYQPDNYASAFVMYCKKSCTTTISIGGDYSNRYFPIVNGVRRDWGSGAGYIGPGTDTLALSTGDTFTIGVDQFYSVTGDYDLPAWAGDAGEMISLIDPAQDGNGAGDNVSVLHLSQTQYATPFYNAGIQPLLVYADVGVAWSLRLPAGANSDRASTISGTGPAALTLNLWNLGADPDNLCVGIFTWTQKVMGVSRQITKELGL